ncbi:MAG: inorganic diphosphatase [Burkholderiales bacterium]
MQPPSDTGNASDAPLLDVVIEIPRGSRIKRGSTGHIDFISPLPCPFNYGSVPAFIGQEGDLLDAVVLGPPLPRGARLRVAARGAVILIDRGMTDDKLICSVAPLGPDERERVLAFFARYARLKGWLNLLRRRRGRNTCGGWCEVGEAMARALPRDDLWMGPPVPF